MGRDNLATLVLFSSGSCKFVTWLRLVHIRAQRYDHGSVLFCILNPAEDASRHREHIWGEADTEKRSTALQLVPKIDESGLPIFIKKTSTSQGIALFRKCVYLLSWIFFLVE